MVHLSWWHYANLYRIGAIPDVDVVLCDHALGEMYPHAMRYNAQMAQMMLSKSPVGLVLYESIGEPRFQTEEYVRLHFERVGLNHHVNTGSVKTAGVKHKVRSDIARFLERRPGTRSGASAATSFPTATRRRRCPTSSIAASASRRLRPRIEHPAAHRQA